MIGSLPSTGRPENIVSPILANSIQSTCFLGDFVCLFFGGGEVCS